MWGYRKVSRGADMVYEQGNAMIGKSNNDRKGSIDIICHYLTSVSARGGEP